MGILNSEGFAQIGNASGVEIVLRFMMVAFLGLNLWYRFSTIFDYSRFVGGLFIFLGICSLGVILFPNLLRAFLFFFGVSFFLFGFRAYDIQSQVFETVVVFVALTLFFVNLREESSDQGARDGGQKGKDSSQLNQQLVGLIFCYVALSLFSLLLLPLGHMVRDFLNFGFESYALGIANATPNSHLYPLGGINRLILFFMLAYGLATGVNPRERYRWLFMGLFVGTVFCALLGLLDFYGIVSLNWYRKISTPGALHSMFLNRGWFAEFVLTLVPFVLLGFMSKIKGIWWKVALFSSLVICELALILAGARAGWVSYPLILFICWLFSYFSKEGRFESFHFGWKDLLKVAVSVPLTIGISFLLIFQVLMPLSAYLGEKTGSKGIQTKSKASTALIERQASRILDVGKGGRLYTWGEGYNVGRERPVFGMGYESFNWHANILADLPESYVHRFHTEKKMKRIHDTPHSIFYQLFVSGGIVGLCLWMIILLYALAILLVDTIKNGRLINIPVAISIISFHIYGIFQSMQYIPMIWSLIFLNLGYAMTINDKVLSERLRRITGVVVKVMIFLVLIGGVVYFTGRGSQGLAEKYGLRVYAKDQNWHNYLGFYPMEKGPSGDFRWSGKEGMIRIHGDGLLEIRLDCDTPGMDKEPVMVEISVDDQPVDRLVFEGIGSRTWWYWLKKRDKGPHEVQIKVSRTWNPRKLGMSVDNRDLGVRVGEYRFFSNLPKDGIGFYGWETMGDEGLRTEDGGRKTEGRRAKRFRWTGKRASQSIAEFGMRDADLGKRGKGVSKHKGAGGLDEGAGGPVVFLRCSHPDISKASVVVRILGDGELLRYIEFSDYGWKRVELGDEELEGKGIVTYEVSRVWNPKRMGVSGDRRDLGVPYQSVKSSSFLSKIRASAMARPSS